MELSGIAPGRRIAGALDRALARAEGAGLTYDHVGSTLCAGPTADVPDHAAEREVTGALADAAAALRRWAAHDGIRARVHPAGAPLSEGTTLVVVVPFGPVEMAAPTRIVAVVDAPDRFGFAYGTLPGHPERGEELFLAEVIGPGRLRLTVRVQARPATTLAKVSAPLVRRFQRAAARRYLDGWSAGIAVARSARS